MIRPAVIADAQQICDIYNYYIRNTAITFEEQAVTPQEMENRITEITQELPWLVNEEDGKITGYAYAGKWKGRCAYRYSAELTVYLDKDSFGKGTGTELYWALLEDVKSKGMHVAIGGIALPNTRSQRLHEKLGFEKVAHFAEVGYKFGRWIDIGYWELVLQRDTGEQK